MSSAPELLLAGLADVPIWIGLVVVGVAVGVLGARRRTGPSEDAGFVDLLQRLGAEVETGPLLNELARAVRERFGFGHVVVRLYNERARIFEARAFAGLDESRIACCSTHDVPRDVFDAAYGAGDDLGGVRCVRHGDLGCPEKCADPTASTEVVVVPLLDEHGAPCGYLSATTDGIRPDDTTAEQLQVLAAAAAAGVRAARLRTLLQRRELEYAVVSEQLRESQGLRDNFVANVSHELRTPLTSVKAYAETLARGIDSMDPDTRREFVAVIEHEAERLDQVFDDLLDVAHLEGRARRVARDRLDLRELVQAACTDEREAFERAGLELRVFGPAEPLRAQGDAEGLRQVLGHLLDNARKFTPPEGRVHVTLRAEAGAALITVEDTGIGIPEQELTRVFERFYQVDGSATRVYGGQGLGLSLCRDIIGWHHGRIWAAAVPDGGTRIHVQLPLRGLVVRQRTGDDTVDPAERAQWESFLKLGIHLVSELAGTRVASIMLVDELYGVLRVEAAVGLDEDVVQNSTLGPGEGVAGCVWSTGESIVVPDLDADPRFQGLSDDVNYGRRSLLSVPLSWQGRVVGVLNVNSKHDGTPFDDDDRLLLEALADRLVIALDHFELYRAGYARLASVESGVRAMLEVGRERQTRVRELLARLGMQTGRRLGLDEEHLRALAYASRTYDVGLSEVGGRILRKVTPLSREERERIDDHVRRGAELVADLEPSSQVRKMILHHHENHDGSGYPDGLRGEAIPVGARIVRLIDVLGALLHERPFRNALPLGTAVGLIGDEIGHRYCPRVTPVFLEVVAEHEDEIRELLRPVPTVAPTEIELGSGSIVS